MVFLPFAAAVVSLAALMPLGFVLWMAVFTGWDTVYAMVVRPRVGELLLNTALLVVCTLPPTAAVSLALAWLTERTDLPGRHLWSWLAVAPLAIPAFVHSYAWITVAPGLQGLSAAVFVSTLAYFPFLYLPIVAQLRRLDPALEEAGATLGLSPGRVFLEVVLPQLRLALCGGSLLIGLHLLAEYGLYVMIRFDTFTTAIVDQFEASFNGPAATMLAGVLVLCCAGLIGGEGLLRGRGRYSRIGSGAPRPAHRVPLGRATLPALASCAVVASMSVGVPVYVLTRWLALGGVEAWSTGELASAVATTVILSMVGGLGTTIAVLPMAWLSVRRHSRIGQLMEACHYYVGSLPGVVVALALVTITIRLVPALYQTSATLLLAYGLLFLPRALVAVRASIAQVPSQLEEAAQVLGRTGARSIVEVTLRLAAPGISASMALVGLGISTELTATLMLSPNGTDTLATRFWSLTSEIDYVAAAPYAGLMILFSLPLTILLHRQAGRAIGR